MPPQSLWAKSNLGGQILSQFIAGKVQAVYRRSASSRLSAWDNSMVDLEAFWGVEIHIFMAQSSELAWWKCPWVRHADFDTFIQIGNGRVVVDAGDARVSNMELHILPDLGYSHGILLSRSRPNILDRCIRTSLLLPLSLKWLQTASILGLSKGSYLRWNNLHPFWVNSLFLLREFSKPLEWVGALGGVVCL